MRGFVAARSMGRPALPAPRAARVAAVLTVAALVTASVVPSASAAVAPHRSWAHLPLSNGFGVAVYDADAGKFHALLDHPYARWDAATPSIDVLFDSYFGLATTGTAGVWLNALPVEEARYEDGRGVLVVRQRAGDIALRTVAFAPWDLPGPALALVLEATNTGAQEQPLRLFHLLNAHVGPAPADRPGEAGFDDEEIVWDAGRGRFLERGTTTAHALAYAPLDAPTVRAAFAAGSPDNPWLRVTEDGALTPGDGGAVADDQVAAFQWDRTLAPGATTRVAVVLAYAPVAQADPAPLHAALDGWRAGRDGEELLAAEQAGWDAWQTATRWPDGDSLPAAAAALYRQSLVMLRMGQVREPNGPDGTPHGQLLASLPPGQWNISWPRDAAYAIRALALAGHATEARDALAFILNGHGQAFAAEAQGPYLVSVCRYFGNGAEESDENEFGPNIEFDGFGLFLWALETYLERSGDEAFLAAHWPAVRDGVADALVRLIDPETGLVRADSSIWEVHWDGQQKRFAYTSILAVRGLCAAADMAARQGDGARASTYRETARGIDAAIRTHLVDSSGFLAANLEELRRGSGYVDAAVVEAVNLGLVAPDDPVAASTIDGLRAALAVPSGQGYARNDDGGWYDRQEWVVIDLRLARALRALGRDAEADALTAWVVAQSAANAGLVAELYERESADYEGAVPMMGFGAGAFVLDAWERDVPAPLAGTCWTATPADPDVPVAEPRDVAQPDAVPDAAEDVPALAEVVDVGDETAPDAGGPDPDLGPARPDVAGLDIVLDLSPARPTRGGGCAALPSGARSPAGPGMLLVMALCLLGATRRWRA